jgi:hypothetical protein
MAAANLSIKGKEEDFVLIRYSPFAKKQRRSKNKQFCLTVLQLSRDRIDNEKFHQSFFGENVRSWTLNEKTLDFVLPDKLCVTDVFTSSDAVMASTTKVLA